MREILFRGKRKDNGEWVYWNIYSEIRTSKGRRTRLIIKTPYSEINFLYIYEYLIDPETIGQFTGLTDKNGKGIFEGDIVDILDENEEIGVIKWADDDAMFTINSDGWYTSFNIYWSIDLEVIGNIHDKPELLKGGKEK